MHAPGQLQRRATLVLALAMVAIGVAMLAATLAGGGGPLSYGTVVGVLFVALGIGRLYLLRALRRGEDDEP